MMFCKKTAYDKFVVKVNALDTKTPKKLVDYSLKKVWFRQQCLDKKIKDFDKKIPNTSELVKKKWLQNKNCWEWKQVPSVSGLVTAAAFNTKCLIWLTLPKIPFWLLKWQKLILKCLKLLIFNHVDNILRLFDGWAKFPFTTSETTHDY